MLTDTSCQIAVDSEDGRHLRLILRDSLTIYQAEALFETIMALLQSEADVVVSCGEVVRLDTSALQILLVLQRELHARGRSIRLEDVPDRLRGLLELGGLNGMLSWQSAAHGAS